MRIDKLHKFSDGTLDDVQTDLNDRLKGIRMQYLPQTIWRQRDKDNTGAMIQVIDKQLKTSRIMQSLEKFVGGRPYEAAKPCQGDSLEFYLITGTPDDCDEVLKLKNFKKYATLKLFKSTIKNGMSMSVQKSQVHKDGKVTRWRNKIMLG
ncbi:hypothetical protein Tco_0952998 [Tanacetum coccineum]|uniref:Uncharacterized protein n=1 Tax=Tanacetum coccineum TaxID=301880 RepID=A0ABQ5E0G4_9ASTR